MAVLNWLKKAVKSVVDPERDGRVNQLESLIKNLIQQSGDSFDLDQIVLQGDFCRADLMDACTGVYLKEIEKAWSDLLITKKERQHLIWLQRKLEISPENATNLQESFVKDAFQRVLANAMQDGAITERELRHLDHIAAQIRLTTKTFAATFFQTESESFLQGIFLAAISDGDLNQGEWDNLLDAATKLGVSNDHFFVLIRPSAKLFVEHVIADAKADGQLTGIEKSKLLWLIANLKLPDATLTYVKTEINNLTLKHQIEEGHLPNLEKPRGIEGRPGELFHLKEPCHFCQIRSSGKRDEHYGNMIVTNLRTLLISNTKSFSFRHGKVFKHNGNDSTLELYGARSSPIYVKFDWPNPLNYLIFSMAVAIANQTKTPLLKEKKNRYITRETRQLIWQRYGGKCADCSATQYLEYDHIIPVAKGGSNGEKNIQLLCRKCNLKKSDKI